MAPSPELRVEEVAAVVVAVAVVEVALGLRHQMLLQGEVARNVKETPFSFKISHKKVTPQMEGGWKLDTSPPLLFSRPFFFLKDFYGSKTKEKRGRAGRRR